MWISLSCAASLTSSLVAALSDNELSAELKDLSHGTAGKPVICSRLTECAEQLLLRLRPPMRIREETGSWLRIQPPAPPFLCVS
ncbi:hypothetical protein C0Q70_07106 [Pomacea canaliculata]|uniref:Secreted protein n=1 Tax=Pomacea canaliculata TaxID=400727 RepID=A0A2T7PE56_POMCA|nr:hypothetical protein C0Q70_07106 [Pomacea canaliculata]